LRAPLPGPSFTLNRPLTPARIPLNSTPAESQWGKRSPDALQIAVLAPATRSPFTLDATLLRWVDAKDACARASGQPGLSPTWILVYSSLMRGKSGRWGNPITRATANAMRLRGLDTRRWKSEKRLARALCGGEPTEPVRRARLAGPEPSQPSKPQGSDAAKLNPAVEANAVRTQTAPVPVLHPGEEIRYGYQLSPGGPWVEAKPPAHNPHGLLEAAVLRAQRMYPRHWSGKRPHDAPK